MDEADFTLGDIHKDLKALVERGAHPGSIEWVLRHQIVWPEGSEPGPLMAGRDPDKAYGDACEAGMGSCYICGDERDHDGLPHGGITRAEFDLIRARTERDTLVMVRDEPTVQKTIDARIARLNRQIEKMESQ